MPDMSSANTDSVSLEGEDSSLESRRKNGKVQDEKDSHHAMQRKLHMASGEMTHASSADKGPKNYLTLTYLMWENNSNICWLDASISLLIHNRSLRHLVDGKKSLVSQSIKTFDAAMGLLNDDNNPKDIHLRLLEAKGMLKQIQDDTLRYLQPLMKFEDGKPDSAFCSLYNLIKEDKSTRDIFELEYTQALNCLKCQYHKMRRIKKLTITLSNAKVFNPLAPMSVCECPGCKEPDQVLKLTYRSLPQSLIFHFERGAGKGEFSSLDFSLCDRHYQLTGLMVLEKCLEDETLNHFVTWIRDPLTDSWLECNDLNSEIKTFSVIFPTIQLEDVYITMYEAMDSKGTVPNGSTSEEEEDSDNGVSKGGSDIPFIDLSDDEAKDVEDDTDESKDRGSKVTSCKVQKSNAATKQDQSKLLKAELEPNSLIVGSNEGEVVNGSNCLPLESQKGVSKSLKNKCSKVLSSIAEKKNQFHSNMQGRDLLAEDIEFNNLMEKIQKVKESSAIMKLRSDANFSQVKEEQDGNKLESERCYMNANSKDGDICPAKSEEKASLAGPASKNIDLKQNGGTEIVLNSPESIEESKENLIFLNSQKVNSINHPEKCDSVESIASKVLSDSNVEINAVKEDETNVAFNVVPKSRCKPPLRRSCRARKFTPKIIESLRQSKEEKESDLMTETRVASKRRGQHLNGIKSPQHGGKQAKVAQNLYVSPKRKSTADKVEKIFNPKEWDVRRIDPPVQLSVLPPLVNESELTRTDIYKSSYSEEVSKYLDLTLVELKEKITSERKEAWKNVENSVSTTSVLLKKANCNKAIENSSINRPEVLSEIAVVFGSSSNRVLVPEKDSVPASETACVALHKTVCDESLSKAPGLPANSGASSSGRVLLVENGILNSSGEISMNGSEPISPAAKLRSVGQDTKESFLPDGNKPTKLASQDEDSRRVMCDSLVPNCADEAPPNVPLSRPLGACAKRKVELGTDYSSRGKRTRTDSKCDNSIEDSIHSTIENFFRFTCNFFQVDQNLIGKKMSQKL